MTLDLDLLRDRLRAALPQLSCELVKLEHVDTRECCVALSMKAPDRKRDHVYRMTVAIIDGKVNFFLHVHGTSEDLTTRGALRLSKECGDLDEVFAVVHSCWTGGPPS